LHYAYLDESGNTIPFDKSERFLVVAVLVADAASARAVELHIKRLQKKLGSRTGSELKAFASTTEQALRLLRAIAQEDVAIVTVIIDKRWVRRRPADTEDWYRQAVGLAAYHCTGRWPRLHLVLDKRYTKKALRDELEDAIRLRLEGIPQDSITIEHLDSETSRGLQATDYVAWAIRQKYERGETQYYEALARQIVVEVVVKAK
jgi:Fe2+ transport system protein B